MVFCNDFIRGRYIDDIHVTILILIDGFLQYKQIKTYNLLDTSHNPYFNRWFSAMHLEAMSDDDNIVVTILILIDGFLQ